MRSRPATSGRRRPLGGLQAYVAVVTLAGVGLLAWLSVRGGLADLLYHASSATWVYIALIVFGELRPVRGLLRRESDEITISTPFAFALLLSEGTGAGVVALAAASTVADLLRRKPLRRLAFNAAQFTLALAAGGTVLSAFPRAAVFTGEAPLTLAALPTLLLAGLVFFLVNNTLAGVVVALDEGEKVWRFLWRDFAFQLSTAGVMLGLAPIVVVAADRSVALLPLLLLPLTAVYRAARVSLEKDYAASHDALTDLPNRVQFRDRGRERIEKARRTRGQVAVLLIDLDHFKDVNDTLGHHVGDQMLQQVGPRLHAVGGGQATIARLGGDEFGLLLDGPVDGVDRSCQRVLGAFAEPFVVQGFSLEIQASVGVACYPDHGPGIETLIQRADIAMYQAKRRHLGFEVYVPQRDTHSRRRLQLVGELRRGIDEQQLILHYQPIADLQTGRFGGVEALVRWRHPEHGLLSPDEFIPLAERTGLIGPLTLYVLDAALRQCKAWQREGLELGVSVNLSVRNLYEAAFPAHVARMLAVHEVDPALLKLEITESLVMADPPRAQRVLDELSDLGLRLSIDDFGTGYTSLGLLKHLPVNEVKIDKSFVMDMTTNSGDAVIVRSVIDLARNLRLSVVAEGVETEEILTELGRLGCDHAQGYHLGRGLPADEVVAVVTQPLAPPRLTCRSDPQQVVLPDATSADKQGNGQRLQNGRRLP